MRQIYWIYSFYFIISLLAVIYLFIYFFVFFICSTTEFNALQLDAMLNANVCNVDVGRVLSTANYDWTAAMMVMVVIFSGCNCYWAISMHHCVEKFVDGDCNIKKMSTTTTTFKNI